jgi:2-dehydro-3-deoxyphosphogluconate aldolase / (4S)-4-hydroxy-2-oxoglutarate aldolase
MARFTRIDVALTMQRIGIVPLFYRRDLSVCKEIIRACHAGGAGVIEFTNRGDFAHETFGELVKFTANELPDLMLGAGSIVDPSTAALYLQSGADFIVSPLLNESIARVCNRRKVLWIPGCSTLSEIGRAEEAGAEICKVFPGDAVTGPAFIKAVRGPCPWTSLMPTGGVDPTKENLVRWFDAGACCVGMGSGLITNDIMATGNFDLLKQNVEMTVKIVRGIRKTDGC